jgi:hypothetical protein
MSLARSAPCSTADLFPAPAKANRSTTRVGAGGVGQVTKEFEFMGIEEQIRALVAENSTLKHLAFPEYERPQPDGLERDPGDFGELRDLDEDEIDDIDDGEAPDSVGIMRLVQMARRVLAMKRACAGGEPATTNELPLGLERTSSPSPSAMTVATMPPADQEHFRAIARELGVAGLEDLGALRAAVERMKDPTGSDEGPAFVKAGDTLQAAMDHNKSERLELLRSLELARGILSRLAASLQVSQWNVDGDELVEKAQRLSVFAHWLKKRSAELQKELRGCDCIETRARIDFAIAEYRTIFAALVGNKDLAKWVQADPKRQVSTAVADLAESPTTSTSSHRTYLDELFTNADLFTVGHAVIAADQRQSSIGDKRLTQLALMFERLLRSRVATDEAVVAFNAILLPLLRRDPVL